MLWWLVTVVRAAIEKADNVGGEIMVKQLRIADNVINSCSIAVAAYVLPCPALCVIPSDFEYRGPQV
jgi:hypothetical protein